MTQQLRRPERFFFGTRILNCPYLPDQLERKVVTDLNGPNTEGLYEKLSRAGFRRSHGLAYRPACPGCSACVPARIRASEFRMGKTFRRTLRANADLTVENTAACATDEQYRLFIRYQQGRHSGGDMSEMTFEDFQSMIEESPVDTRVTEYRLPDGKLAAFMLSDRIQDSLSAVYSCFDTDMPERSLGSMMILRLVEEAQEEALPYVYLGYWIKGSEKMGYKSRFKPLEGLTEAGWEIID